MIHMMADPHPGRCRNFRQQVHPDGHIESLRCLDYEALKHFCTFPEPTHVVSEGAGYFNNTKTTVAVPWVKP